MDMCVLDWRGMGSQGESENGSHQVRECRKCER